MGRDLMCRTLHPLGTREKFFFHGTILIHQFYFAIRTARDLDMVIRFIRQVEGDGLSGKGIAVPVRQLEIVVPPLQARTIVYTRPGRLSYAVAALIPPALQVIGIVNLHLAGHGHARDSGNPARKTAAQKKSFSDLRILAVWLIGRLQGPLSSI